MKAAQVQCAASISIVTFFRLTNLSLSGRVCESNIKSKTIVGLLSPKGARFAQWGAIAAATGLSSAAHGAMVITPTFTANFNANFGANAAAAQAAWISAANVFTANFSDNIHI